MTSIKYTLCLYPIAFTSTVVEFPQRSLEVLCWQDDEVSVFHNAFIIPKGRCVCICSNHFVHQWLLLSLLPLHCTETNAARMGFKHHRTYPEFHVHIKRLGGWESEGIWAFVGGISGVVGRWGNWIRFHDLESFYGFQ